MKLYINGFHDSIFYFNFRIDNTIKEIIKTRLNEFIIIKAPLISFGLFLTTRIL